jgi:glycosyltransferase involved in cell wall biosynthesis
MAASSVDDRTICHMSIDLTVIVPIFNGMPHLAETIDSILVQGQPRFELLLINDGSNDEGRTKSYLDSLTDSRVRVIHKDNEGLCLTMNLGFREARGSYVARVDQDDLCAPRRFEIQHTYLESHPTVDVVFSHTYKFGDKRVWHNPDKMSGGTAQKRVITYDALQHGSILHSTMMGRRSVFLEIGGYRQAYYPSDDYDLGLRLTEQYTVHILPDPLVLYRFHAGANTYKYFDRMQTTSRWAKDNARRRRSGLEERSLENYVQEGLPARWEHLNRKRKDAGRFYIRQAGQYFLDGRYGAAVFPLIIGTSLAPLAVFSRLSRGARNMIRWTLSR